MFRASIRSGVELRLLEERHAAPIFSLIDRDREYLREWLPFVDATLVEDDTLSFIRFSLEQFATNGGLTAGIWCGEQVCGVLGTRRIDWINRRVELGYWLGKSFQGKGIMTDCCRAMVNHLFDELNLNRVEIQSAVGNTKSAAVAKRLGFTLEGTRRQAELVNGEYLDLLMFGMVKGDWHA
jgi:ribosomal-protein-serine acetyltransferase